MIAFYEIDNNYINFLKLYDSQIPNIAYSSNNKFVCGIVLKINGCQYYAPVSHFNRKQRTNFPIYNNGHIISTIRLCFMFPIPSDQTILKKIDFNLLKIKDSKYAQLVQYEYFYCKKNLNELLAQAQNVYKIGTNKNHILNKTCCDFTYLESIYNNYNPTIDYSKVLVSA